MKERIEYYKQHRKYDHADHTICKVFPNIVLKDLDAHFLIYFSVVILDQKLFDLVRDLQALYDRAFPGSSRETGCLSHLFHLLIKPLAFKALSFIVSYTAVLCSSQAAACGIATRAANSVMKRDIAETAIFIKPL